MEEGRRKREALSYTELRGKIEEGRWKQLPEPFGEDERRQKRDKTTVMRMMQYVPGGCG
jgi:hypothetical protein